MQDDAEDYSVRGAHWEGKRCAPTAGPGCSGSTAALTRFIASRHRTEAEDAVRAQDRYDILSCTKVEHSHTQHTRRTRRTWCRAVGPTSSGELRARGRTIGYCAHLLRDGRLDGHRRVTSYHRPPARVLFFAAAEGMGAVRCDDGRRCSRARYKRDAVRESPPNVSHESPVFAPVTGSAAATGFVRRARALPHPSPSAQGTEGALVILP